MDDEQDDSREGEAGAETENRESHGGMEEPAAPEEPEVYTPEEYQLAVQIKSRRLYKEEHGRFPHNSGELTHFLIKADIERPITPDDDDLKAARQRLQAADS